MGGAVRIAAVCQSCEVGRSRRGLGLGYLVRVMGLNMIELGVAFCLDIVRDYYFLGVSGFYFFILLDDVLGMYFNTFLRKPCTDWLGGALSL